MTAHTHVTPVHVGAAVVGCVAVFGTLHLLALSKDSRWGRALLALGF